MLEPCPVGLAARFTLTKYRVPEINAVANGLLQPGQNLLASSLAGFVWEIRNIESMDILQTLFKRLGLQSLASQNCPGSTF